ncbi:MAG: AbrB/MazE/SpoVT family DNA-binding domain-containing protein [Synechococcaceae cyanobacterium]|nr:AbrB/MazE/SpoVT family DNA-binding domain-containing protein [Synechococcaceae cyanobacterium]
MLSTIHPPWCGPGSPQPGNKGQLTIPRQLREALGLAAGARLQPSIDYQGRLVLVPSKYEPEDLFRERPSVQRSMSLADMDWAIAAAVGREDP